MLAFRYLFFLMNHSYTPPTRIISRLDDIKRFLGLTLLINFQSSVILRKYVCLRSDLKHISKLPYHFRDVPPHQIFPAKVLRPRKMIYLLVLQRVPHCFGARRPSPKQIPLCPTGHLKPSLLHRIHHRIVHMRRAVDSKRQIIPILLKLVLRVLRYEIWIFNSL